MKTMAQYLWDHVLREDLKENLKNVHMFNNPQSLFVTLHTRFTRTTGLNKRKHDYLFRIRLLNVIYLSTVSRSATFTLKNDKTSNDEIRFFCSSFTLVPLHPSRPGKPEEEKFTFDLHLRSSDYLPSGP